VFALCRIDRSGELVPDQSLIATGTGRRILLLNEPVRLVDNGASERYSVGQPFTSDLVGCESRITWRRPGDLGPCPL
jgi:hypothetical protein